jgi:hypothetical protein
MTVQQQFRRRLFFLGFIWLTVIAASAHAQSSSKKVRIGVSETHVSYLPAEEVQFLIDLMRTNAKISRPVTVEQVADFSFVDKARKDLGVTR